MRISRTLLQHASALLATTLLCSSAQAASYASALANNSGAVSFTLNEPATNVKIAWSGGTNDLGALPKGPYTSANLGVTGVFRVIVNSSLPGGYTQISDDANNLLKFNSPRGVTVNQRANSPAFGRIYVANSAVGTTGGRTLGDGIYIINPDLTDALGKGDTATTAGITFTASSNDPFRLGIGEDGSLYINNFGSVNACTWATDPDMTAATNIFQGIGASANPTVHTDPASKIIAQGSLAAGNLVLYMTDGSMAGAYNKIGRWTIGAGPLPWNTPPTMLGATGITSSKGTTTDMDIAPDGKFFAMVNRSSATDANSLIVYDTDGVTRLFASRDISGGTDPLAQSRGMKVSPDGTIVALVHDNNSISIVKLTNGIPDLSSRSVIANTPNTIYGRDINFDAAGNIYVVSSGQGLLRVYSLGGVHIATTSSDGTFNILAPFPMVSVRSTDSLASEASVDQGEFTFTRTGDTSADLTVYYTLSGTASNGLDCVTLPGSIVIPAGATTATLPMIPVDDSTPELAETLTLTVSTNQNYAPDVPVSASIKISDNETPELSVETAAATAYEGSMGDYVKFNIIRRGDINVYLTANLAYSGTAPATRYEPLPSIDLDFGVVTQSFNVPITGNTILDGDQTIIASVAAGTGYNPAPGNSATATILDDELPAENPVFSDSLTANTSAQWDLRFGANNLVNDYLAAFGADVTGDGIFTVPNGGFNALKLTVNKDDPTTNGAAGINLYPKSLNLSGDYIVRFSMCLMQNSVSGTTEYALFGINHSGLKTNWIWQSGSNTVYNPPKDCDGLWFAVESDASATAPGDYSLLTGTNANSGPTVLATAAATSFRQIFKNPPYTPGTTGSGVPANIVGSSWPVWADVEIKQINNLITLNINRTKILEYTNTTPYTSGKLMLGYMDSWESIGNAGGCVFYSNLRVMTVAPTQAPSIRGAKVINNGSQIQIDFAASAADTTTSFKLQSSPLVAGGYTEVAGATFVQQSAGVFRVTAPTGGNARFYRLRR